MPKSTSQSSKQPDKWRLHDAKTRFAELIRRAQAEGPQHITVRGRETVVVVSESDYARLTGARSGKLLVDLLAESPLRELEFENEGVRTQR